MGRRCPPGVAFTYAPGRGGQHAERILQGFSGVLQIDGYAGYNRLVAPDRIGSDIRLAYPSRKPVDRQKIKFALEEIYRVAPANYDWSKIGIRV